jgi:hypothetical protein
MTSRLLRNHNRVLQCFRPNQSRLKVGPNMALLCRCRERGFALLQLRLRLLKEITKILGDGCEIDRLHASSKATKRQRRHP